MKKKNVKVLGKTFIIVLALLGIASPVYAATKQKIYDKKMIRTTEVTCSNVKKGGKCTMTWSKDYLNASTPYVTCSTTGAYGQTQRAVVRENFIYPFYSEYVAECANEDSDGRTKNMTIKALEVL